MKYILIFKIFIMLLTVSTIASASTDPAEIPITKTESPVDMPETTLIALHFWGDLELWINGNDELVVHCEPPFIPRCYSIYWFITTPEDKTVVLNDGNDTEISVSSEAVITTDESGTKIHTFTK